jgi:hypothetical protein
MDSRLRATSRGSRRADRLRRLAANVARTGWTEAQNPDHATIVHNPLANCLRATLVKLRRRPSSNVMRSTH